MIINIMEMWRLEKMCSESLDWLSVYHLPWTLLDLFIYRIPRILIWLGPKGIEYTSQFSRHYKVLFEISIESVRVRLTPRAPENLPNRLSARRTERPCCTFHSDISQYSQCCWLLAAVDNICSPKYNQGNISPLSLFLSVFRAFRRLTKMSNK